MRCASLCDIHVNSTFFGMRSFSLRSFVSACCLLGCGVLAACGGGDRDADAQATLPTLPAGIAIESDGAPAALPTGSPEELEAESSLSVKRGVITLTAQSRSIRLCGSNIDLTLADQLDGALDAVYARLGGKPVYAEMFGERGDGAIAFNLEELLYATSANVAGACQTRLGGYELLALGVDPEWSVEVRPDAMTLTRAAASAPVQFTSVETADTEGAVTYRAGGDGHVLELVITQRGCGNPDRAEYFAYTATARFDKQSFNGCARVGE
jgi:uncharacterized membrane protein